MNIDTVTDAITALLPEIRERAADIEDARRLPADLAQKMAETGIFRMITPKSMGGLETTPRQMVEMVELLATADASAGWCGMIAATTALNAAYMEPAIASGIYAEPMAITGGVFAPMGKAVDEGSHYRVSGRWQWGSGSANCSWLCGGCLVIENGDMKKLPSGAPDIRMMVFPAEDAILHDTWHVMGLKGTGSGDIEVKDILVPKERTVSLMSDTPYESGALYKFPPFGLLSLGVSAVALGNARGAIDAFKDLALAKKPMAKSKLMADIPAIQVTHAKMEADWRAARAYLFSEIDRVWAIAENTERHIPVEARADLRLACTHMTRTAADICRTAYDFAGGAALFEHSELQRRFRDAHAATQHIVTSGITYEFLGRVLLDLPINADQI